MGSLFFCVGFVLLVLTAYLNMMLLYCLIRLLICLIPPNLGGCGSGDVVVYIIGCLESCCIVYPAEPGHRYKLQIFVIIYAAFY